VNRAISRAVEAATQPAFYELFTTQKQLTPTWGIRSGYSRVCPWPRRCREASAAA